MKTRNHTKLNWHRKDNKMCDACIHWLFAPSSDTTHELETINPGEYRAPVMEFHELTVASTQASETLRLTDFHCYLVHKLQHLNTLDSIHLDTEVRHRGMPVYLYDERSWDYIMSHRDRRTCAGIVTLRGTFYATNVIGLPPHECLAVMLAESHDLLFYCTRTRRRLEMCRARITEMHFDAAFNF